MRSLTRAEQVEVFRIPVSAATRSKLPGIRGRVEVTEKHLRIKFGVRFVGIVARSSIRSAAVTRTTRVSPPGASEHGGGWVVHGRAGGAVRLDFRPAAAVRVAGSSVRTSRVTVGVDDAAGLVASLGFGPRLLRYESAGCVVVRDDGRVLLLARRGEVRLPKGHIDPGEVPEVTALRELAEESGLDDVELLSLVGSGPAVFDRLDADGAPVRIERHEHWYLCRLVSERTVERPPADQDWLLNWATWDEAAATLTYDGERAWATRAQALHHS
jgi:ADP-ribose pyrophosphatase YjhB (NUDIX family)